MKYEIKNIIFLFIILIVSLFYFAIMQSSKIQASVGKKLLGIKVTDLYGEKISFSKALLRFLLKIISFIILGIGFLMPLWEEKKQTFHDRIAKTLVIH